MDPICMGTPLRAIRSGANETEITFGGVGCTRLPLLGYVSIGPSVMADGMVGVSIMSSSDTLRFLGIPRLDMTRGFYLNHDVFRMTSATGIPIRQLGPFVPTVTTTSDIPLSPQGQRAFALSLGVRVAW